MKKIITLFLALNIAFVCLGGCVSDKPENITETTTEGTTEIYTENETTTEAETTTEVSTTEESTTHEATTKHEQYITNSVLKLYGLI